MLIVIDAYQMRDAITGTDRLAHNLLRELQAIDTENQYIVIVNADQRYVSDVVTAPNFTLRPTRFKKRASWILFGLPVLLVRLRADVFFSFHNLVAPGLPVCRSVVSVLDLIPFFYQKRYYAGWKSYWFRRLIVLGYMRVATKTGSAFWAISKFTKDQMVDYFHTDPRKIQVGFLQADPIFSKEPSPGKLAALSDKYGLEKNYIYAIGGAEPRKNNLTLIAAHRKLPGELRSAYPLVIAGAKWQGEDLVKSDDPHVILAGYVSDEEHALLYHAATAFVCASRYEGFGLPIVEAMASGAPVISSNTTSLPEAAGKAALLVDPDDVNGMAEALRTLMTDKGERDRLVKEGSEQIKLFSWAATAKIIHGMLTKTSSRI
jgi:glycosyltransferase involved in cell wall biosynthesis